MKHHFLKLNADHQALLLASICYFLWVLDDTAFKLSAHYNLPAPETVGIYTSITALFIWLIACAKGNPRTIIPQKPLQPLLRGILSFCISCANYIALKNMPLSAFYTIAFTGSFWLAIGGHFILGETLSLPKALLILLGFIGAVVSVNFSDVSHQSGSLLGYACVTVGALCYGLTQVFLRQLSQRETAESLAFSALSMNAILAVIATIPLYQPIPWQVIMFMVAAAALNAIAGLLMVEAMKRAHASTVASLHYTQIIPGAMFGYLIWHNVPTWNMWLGSCVVIAAGLGMIYLTKKPKEAIGTP